MNKVECEDCEIPLKPFASMEKNNIRVTQYKCEKCFVYYRKIKSLLTGKAELIKIDKYNGQGLENE